MATRTEIQDCLRSFGSRKTAYLCGTTVRDVHKVSGCQDGSFCRGPGCRVRTKTDRRRTR